MPAVVHRRSREVLMLRGDRIAGKPGRVRMLQPPFGACALSGVRVRCWGTAVHTRQIGWIGS